MSIIVTSEALQLDRPIGLNFKVSIRLFDGKGRCLLSDEFIPRDTNIEIAPTVIVPRKQREFLEKTTMTDYYFNLRLGEPPHDVSKLDGCVALGVCNLCNHSDDPNAGYSIRAGVTGYMFYLFSLRDILPGEEICVRYRQPWFEVKPPIKVMPTEVAQS